MILKGFGGFKIIEAPMGEDLPPKSAFLGVIR
jgi:hypothetical protein